MEGFLGGLALERGGGGLAGRACFLEEEGFHSSWIDPTTRGKPASIFLSVRTLGDQHQDKAHRLHYTHTHTTSTTTTISYVNNTTAVESPTPTFSTDTHSQGRRSWPREGPTARRAAKYWLSGISPRLYLYRPCCRQRSLLPAPHQPSNQEDQDT